MKIRAADITYSHVSGLSYKITLTAYISSSTAPDNIVDISLDDGISNTLTLDSTKYLPNNISQCVYSNVHTFIGPGHYIISFEYYGRNAGITNIPGSVNVPYYVETELIINPFLNHNNSATILSTITYNICANHPFNFNMEVHDIDGDSITYKLIQCKGNNGYAISGYTFPASNQNFSIGHTTGILTWSTPTAQGKYSFVILIEEWRHGVYMSSISSDIQLDVVSCQGINMPEIESLPDTICVEAGSLIKIGITATSMSLDTLSLTATGLPLSMSDYPAQFSQPTVGVGIVSSEFVWETHCLHVQKKPYQVVVTAKNINNTSNSQQYEPFANCFDNHTLGIGWYSSNQAQFDSPCDPSADGSGYLWMGNTSAAPRQIISPLVNLSSGGVDICFDMKYAIQGNQPCEGPDSTGEGILLEYSTNGTIGPWTTMEYWDPSIPSPGGFNPVLTNWNNYCLSVPLQAQTSHTTFRWLQKLSSGAYYDHWGLDNIQIYELPINPIDIKNIYLKIVSPAPQNFTVTPQNDAIVLNWEKSVCEQASGYKIYRKNYYYGFVHDTCETGVPAYTGYSLLATLYDVNETTYLDNNNGLGLSQDNKYCYMVIAWFEDGAESYASDERCAELPHTKPIITNVSILHTDSINGSVYVAWSKPKELDSQLQSGPFKYLIYRSIGQSFSFPFLIDSLNNINDTVFIDTLVNTISNAYSYLIELYYDAPGSRFLIGSTQPASSVYAIAEADDHSMILSWQSNVPWLNESYTIYRQNHQTQLFDSLGFTTNHTFKDTLLSNGLRYCYLIRTNGEYSGTHTINPIFNFSQIVCGVPFDSIPPCPPVLSVTTNCINIENYLFWQQIDDPCNDDVIQYRIYYSPFSNTKLEAIATIDDANASSFLHSNLSTIAGCYVVTAIDSFSNESTFSNVVCLDIDSCFLYALPNVFTPNSDGFNDYFTPFPYSFVEKIDIKIINRWGKMIFQCTDPDINWDGANQNTKIECSDGVYYYVCDVYEMRLNGLTKRTIADIIYIIRGPTTWYK